MANKQDILQSLESHFGADADDFIAFEITQHGLSVIQIYRDARVYSTACNTVHEQCRLRRLLTTIIDKVSELDMDAVRKEIEAAEASRA